MWDEQKVRYSRCFWFICVVAWYNATATATTKYVAADASLVTAASSVADVTYHIECSYTGAGLTTVKLSDKNGDTWAIVGGYIRAASGSPVYGATSTTAGDYTVKIYADSAGSKGAELTDGDLATAKANLKAKGGSYTVTATGSGGVRMTTTNPSTSFTTAFGNNINNKVTIGSLSFSTGEPVVTPSAAWYSVSGNADNTVPTAGTSAAEYTASSAKIVIGLE